MSDQHESQTYEARHVRLDRSGRFIAPSKWRKQLGWTKGDLLIVTASDNGCIRFRRFYGTSEELAALDKAAQIKAILAGVGESELDLISEAITSQLKRMTD